MKHLAAKGIQSSTFKRFRIKMCVHVCARARVFAHVHTQTCVWACVFVCVHVLARVWREWWSSCDKMLTSGISGWTIHGKSLYYFCNSFLSSPKRTCSLILEWGTRKKHWCERNIDRLPLVSTQLGTVPAAQACALIRKWTCNLLVYGTTLQATEPHQPGHFCRWKIIVK